MAYQARPILPAPKALVESGQFQLGTFRSPIERINPLDADVSFGLLPSRWKRMRLKEWQHFALVNDEYYISLALFDAKFLALAQVCVYDRKQGKTIFHERQIPPTRIPRLPNELYDAEVRFKGRGFSLDLSNQLKDGLHRIDFDIEGSKALPAVRGSFVCYEPLEELEPLVVCLPFGEGRAMYTHKCICAAEGDLHLGEQKLRFDREASYGLIDIHKGYYPFIMRWHWATGGARRDDGALMGFNLTFNQVKDPEQYNENCLWVDGKIHLLPPVSFSNAESTDATPWQVRDAYGRVDLTFSPEVFRNVDINLLLLKSRYRGPFGSFSGTLKDSDDNEHAVDGWFGMCENFFLRV